MQALNGKVALVTGGGRGLGRAHALALARAGAKVLVNDVGAGGRGDGSSAEPAQEVVAQILALGGEAALNTDSVADWDAARAMVAQAVSQWGRLDIVVNNAGISRFGPLIGEMSREDWDLTIAVNLTGTAAVSHWAAAHWREQGPQAGRAIINTSSPAGVNPLTGSPAYVASKAAVAALTISSAAELASLGVRVNALAPMARTRLVDAVPMIDAMMQRTAEGDPFATDGVAPLVVYLASPGCRFTGRVFGIGGGKVFVFEGWNVRHELAMPAVTPSVDQVATALAQVPSAEQANVVFPTGCIQVHNPSDEVEQALAALENAR